MGCFFLFLMMPLPTTNLSVRPALSDAPPPLTLFLLGFSGLARERTGVE
jgi:hypothetical protein